MTGRICRRLAAALAANLIYMGAATPALAMQILDAADHAELAAEISATGVNRIALHGDRIKRVIRAPGGFSTEHDPETGDLYLRPLRPAMPVTAAPGMAGEPESPDGAPDLAAGYAAVTLFVGTEKGFTYRLTLTPTVRDSAQILIRNGAAPRGAEAGASVQAMAGDARVAALVGLVRAVARREPPPGYAHPDRARTCRRMTALTLIETWRGPRVWRRIVFEAAGPASPGSWSGAGGDADGSADLAGTIEESLGAGRVAALWVAAPGTGPSGGRSRRDR